MEKEVLKLAEEMSETIIRDRRYLHQIPELGTQLPQTASYVCRRLSEMGVPFETMKDYSAVVATLGIPGEKTIGIRADMDALPVTEESGEPFASKNGKMHACGHDAHTAILLGAAAILKQIESSLNGQVKLIFQTSEEIEPSGARLLVQDGVMENPHIDAMLALHMDVQQREGWKTGDVIFHYGAVSAFETPVQIKVSGYGGHGCMPQKCVDPIAILHLIYEAIQCIAAREISPAVPFVLSFGTIQAGSGTGNVIPNEAYIRGSYRTTDPAIQSYMMKRIQEAAETIASLMKGHAEVTFPEGCKAVINDTDMVTFTRKAATEVLGDENVHTDDTVLLDAEDAGWYFEKAPGCYFKLLAGKPSQDGKIYPLHNGKTCLDDSVLYRGTAVFVESARKFLV